MLKLSRFADGFRDHALIKLALQFVIFAFCCASAFGQTAQLRGQVFDQSGAVVPRATVTLSDSSGQVQSAESSNNGSYSFSAIPPGKYRVQSAAPGLEQQPVEITLRPGTQTLRLELKLAVNQQETTVQGEAGSNVSTESANNASSLVLRGKDLQLWRTTPRTLRPICRLSRVHPEDRAEVKST